MAASNPSPLAGAGSLQAPLPTSITQTATPTTVTTSAHLPFPAGDLISLVQTRQTYFKLNPMFLTYTETSPTTCHFTESVSVLPFNLKPYGLARGTIELEHKLDGVVAEIQCENRWLGVPLGKVNVRNRYCIEKVEGEGGEEGARVTLRFEIIKCGRGTEGFIVKTLQRLHRRILVELGKVAAQEVGKKVDG